MQNFWLVTILGNAKANTKGKVLDVRLALTSYDIGLGLRFDHCHNN